MHVPHSLDLYDIHINYLIATNYWLDYYLPETHICSDLYFIKKCNGFIANYKLTNPFMSASDIKSMVVIPFKKIKFGGIFLFRKCR